MTTLFKHPFTFTQEYENYWGSTRQNLNELTQLQVMQGFLTAGMWQKQHEYYMCMGSRKKV